MSKIASDALVEAVAELRQVFPEWRMGQLVANLASAAGVADAEGIWDVEDDALLTAAQRLLERNRGRLEST
jgi:hypothetical protein